MEDGRRENGRSDRWWPDLLEGVKQDAVELLDVVLDDLLVALPPKALCESLEGHGLLVQDAHSRKEFLSQSRGKG